MQKSVFRAEIRLPGIGLHGSAPDPGSNPAFRSRQQRHDHHRDGGDDDAGDAPLRGFVPDQRGAGFVDDVRRQRNEAPAHDSQRGPLHLFTPGMVQIVVEPPEQRRPGGHFDEAVQSEADQGDGPGDCPGDNRDQPFKTVVGDGEVFEPLAPANQFTAVWRGRGCHRSIIR